MNIFNIISGLSMIFCAIALVIFISWEMGVVYTALCMVTYIALSQIAENKISKALTEGNGQRAARRVHANRRRRNFR
jgi:ABC-type bacteriocin/lantibiotic exporter with double-glycine peptidase domain